MYRFNPALRTAYSPTDLDDMHAAEYIGSRGEALDNELAHEVEPADYRPTYQPPQRQSNSSAPATPKQLAFLRVLIGQAERFGYAHGLRHGFAGPATLKAEAAQALDTLVAARNRGWK